MAVDLLWMGWGFNPAIDKAEADPPEPPPVAAMHDLTADGGRVIGVGGLEPNTASRWRLADARGHEQPSVERTARLWYALGGGATASTEAVDPSEPRTPRLLDTFGVRAVLVDRRVDVPSLRDDRIAYDGPGGFVLEHRTALPPAFVAYGWRPAASVEAGLFGVAGGTTAQARDTPVIETSRRAAGRRPARGDARARHRAERHQRHDRGRRAAGRSPGAAGHVLSRLGGDRRRARRPRSKPPTSRSGPCRSRRAGTRCASSTGRRACAGAIISPVALVALLAMSFAAAVVLVDMLQLRCAAGPSLNYR